MYHNIDDKFKIFIANKHSDVIYYPSDFSIINTPISESESENLSKNLYNTCTDKHIVLLLQRSRRKHRIQTISNIQFFKQWQFLDSVSIIYEKASSCSNNGLLPLSESANLLYKGAKPDVSSTAWFNSDKKNASNFWDLGVQQEERSFFTSCYHNKFSWELFYLMYSIASPLIYRDFIISGLQLNTNEIKSVITVTKKMNVSCQIVFQSQEEADKFIETYKEINI